MAIKEAKIALETRLATAFPSIQIAYPAVAFTPPEETYLRCQTVIGRPDDPVIGAKYRRENMTFQVFVISPINKGEAESLTVANTVFDTFKRGTSIHVSSNIIVQIFESPHIAGSSIAENRIIVPVLIPVSVEVFN